MNDLGKIPPQDVNTEEAIIGAIMLQRDAIIQVTDILTEEVFYKPEHRLIFAAARELFQEGIPIDLLTIKNKLRQNGQLESVGGAVYLTKLTDRIASDANIEFHAKIIYEKYILRELIRIAQGTAENAYDDTEDVFDILDSLQNDLLLIMSPLAGRQTQHVKDIYKDVLTELDDAMIRFSEQKTRGIPTGFRRLDAALHGLFLSDLVIIAARPGEGKTTLAINLMNNIAEPTLLFSLEMNKTMIVNRSISSITHVPINNIIEGSVSQSQVGIIADAGTRLAQSEVYIDDTHSISTLEIRAKLKRAVSKYGVKVVFIDYLQLVTLNRDKVSRVVTTRENEVSTITRQLKGLAKELDICIIALSQLNRDIEKRSSKRPMLSDLRESGSIEQDADRVLFIYNDKEDSLTELIIAKNRHGPTGGIELDFDKTVCLFSEHEDWMPGKVGALGDCEF